MRRITPYKSSAEAIRALDNGGRLFHLMCRKNDGRITHGELATASGRSPDQAGPYIYLAMKTFLLEEPEQERVFRCLTMKLRRNLGSWWPFTFGASEIESEGVANTPAIVIGFPTRIEKPGRVIGNTIWPYGCGRNLHYGEEVITKAYNVYEFRETDSGDNVASTAVATSKRSTLLRDDAPCLVGGVLVELLNSRDGVRTHRLVLRAMYYLDLADFAE